MRWIFAGLALALTVASAHAQLSQQAPINSAGQIGQNASRSLSSKTEEPRVKANEKAYDAALHNLPDKQYDPWHGVR
jgi:hypothetical protein